MSSPLNTVEEVLRRYRVSECGCWLWTGTLLGTKYIYGKVRVNGRTQLAHRLAWVDRYGDLPAKYQVRHKCGNLTCINPDHLTMTKNHKQGKVK